MKKTLFIVAIASLAFASCRKDRTCTCTDTSDSPGFTSSTEVRTIKEMKKADAKKWCQSYTSKATAPVASPLANDYGMNCELN